MANERMMERFSPYVLDLPEIAAWPALVRVLERAEKKPNPDWELPLRACRAVGGDPALAEAGAAAIACMQTSIILVDDILDDDPRGEHLRIGPGRAANLALALQAAAFRLVDRIQVSDRRRMAVVDALGRLALATGQGQAWDVQNLSGEENYWKVAHAKSTPFYGAAVQVGAIIGQAPPAVSDGLRDFGIMLGEIIQIHDDLGDAFQIPANPDWQQGRNNLAILYGLTAEHAQRGRLEELSTQIGDEGALREAQQILVACGAVSYCAYQLVERYRHARQTLDALSLHDPEPIQAILRRQIQPLRRLFATIGVAVPEALVEWDE